MGMRIRMGEGVDERQLLRGDGDACGERKGKRRKRDKNVFTKGSVEIK